MGFETGKTEMACPACGAEHIVEWQQYPMRDEGTLKCLKCADTLYSWKGTRDYHTARLKG